MTISKRLVQYKMTQEMAKSLLKGRKGNDRTMDNQKYLCRWVNTNLNLMGTCVEVLTTL